MLKSSLDLLSTWKMSVIPVSAEKIPMVEWKEFQVRLASPNEVHLWFKNNPHANLGIVTGVLSNLLVVDIDAPEAIELVERYLPDSLVVPTVKTPRGMHLYFKHVPGIRNLRDAFPGVDVRAEGGYVVCPPSKGYKWDIGLDAGIPEVPPELLKVLQSGARNSHDNPGQPMTNHDNCAGMTKYPYEQVGPSEGRRDDALFHVALSMLRGGASTDAATEAVLAVAASCNPPFPRDQALLKVQSAIKRAAQATAQDVRDWVSVTTGYFSVADVARELEVKDRDNIRHVLMRMKSKGEVEPYGNRDGMYRLASKAPVFVNPMNIEEEEEFPLLWPLGVEELAKVSQKSVVIIAGETNSGKTGYAINFCHLNLAKYPIRYFSTETTAARFKSRIVNLTVADWGKVQFTDKIISDFHLHIDPAGLNVIDYMEPDVEALWRIASSIQKIFDALTTGVAVICIQKKKGTDYGYGGVFTAFKSELYLAISAGERSVGELKIIKGKTWRSPRNNPYLQKRNFYITYGVQFSRDPKRPEWFCGDGNEEKDY